VTRKKEGCSRVTCWRNFTRSAYTVRALHTPRSSPTLLYSLRLHAPSQACGCQRTLFVQCRHAASPRRWNRGVRSSESIAECALVRASLPSTGEAWSDECHHGPVTRVSGLIVTASLLGGRVGIRTLHVPSEDISGCCTPRMCLHVVRPWLTAVLQAEALGGDERETHRRAAGGGALGLILLTINTRLPIRDLSTRNTHWLAINTRLLALLQVEASFGSTCCPAPVTPLAYSRYMLPCSHHSSRLLALYVALLPSLLSLTRAICCPAPVTPLAYSRSCCRWRPPSAAPTRCTPRYADHEGLGYTQGTCRVHSGYMQGTFRVHAGYIQGTFRVHQGTFRVHAGYIQGTPGYIQGTLGYTACQCRPPRRTPKCCPLFACHPPYLSFSLSLSLSLSLIPPYVSLSFSPIFLSSPLSLSHSPRSLSHPPNLSLILTYLFLIPPISL
jgi:hypothetical protein